MYTIVSTLLLAVAALIILLALWVVIRKSWFIAWLKATITLSFVALGVAIAMVAVDMLSFRTFQVDVPVARVSMKQIQPQLYRVTLNMAEQEAQDFELAGDLWQLDARMITWEGLFALAGLRPGYQFDRISGRYLSLEQEQNAPRTVHEVVHLDSSLDTWRWLFENQAVPGIKARYGSATFVPMRDGAEYTVAIGVDGLIAKPVNSQAVEAVEGWK